MFQARHALFIILFLQPGAADFSDYVDFSVYADYYTGVTDEYAIHGTVPTPFSEFLSGSLDLNAKVGESVTFPCTPNTAGDYYVSWKKENGQQIFLNGTRRLIDPRFQLVDGTSLQISDLVLTDSGRYVCQTTVDPEMEQTHTLDVSLEQCGGYITAEKGFFHSRNYPEKYLPNENCTWKITVPEKNRIILKLKVLELQPGFMCLEDYVELIDGHAENSTVIGRFCNLFFSMEFSSSGNKMALRFVSDGSMEYQGFLAEFQKAEVPCGSVVESETGVIFSPEYPGYYRSNDNCTWNIISPNGERINLRFKTFELEGGNMCETDYVEVYDGPSTSSPSVGKFCGHTTPDVITSSGNQMTLKFVTDSSGQYQGFSSLFNTGSEVVSDVLGPQNDRICGAGMRTGHGTIRSPNYPEPYGRNENCSWTIIVPEDNIIALKFDFLDIESNTGCTLDYVTILDGGGEDSRVLNTVCNKDSLETFWSSRNRMTINFVTDDTIERPGFLATFRKAKLCGGDIFADAGALLSPRGTAVFAYVCSWNIKVPEGYKVLLKMLQDEKIKERRQSFSVSIEDGTGPLLSASFALLKENFIHSRDNEMNITVQSDGSEGLLNFRAEFEKEKCGEHIKKDNGTISSQRYGNTYLPFEDCTWIITVPTGYRIALKFDFFELENSYHCSQDFVDVRDGSRNLNVLLGRFCGSNIPARELYSTKNKMYLRFVSDGSHEFRGFSATFQKIKWSWDDTPTCGGDIVSDAGSIQSPNFPRGYPEYSECTWKITVPGRNRILLRFNAFELEDRENCTDDFVVILDGHDSDSPELGKFCGESIPVAVRSSGNKITVQFTADDGIKKRGFSAEFITEKCEEHLKEDNGTISSRRYGNTYLPFEDYKWIITVPTGYHIALKFDFLELEESFYCSQDFVEVRDGDSNTNILLGKFCGNDVPADELYSSKNKMYLRFASDGLHQYRGFSARFRKQKWSWDDTPICGGDISSDEGSILSPNSPGEYPVYSECTWKITVPERHRVNLRFNAFELEDSENCKDDFVVILDGHDTDSPELGKFCGESIPVAVRSSGNKITVQFTADHAVQKYGFGAQFTSEKCGELINEDNGTISYPKYGNTYSPFENFTWIITVPTGYHIALKFDFFELERSADCSNDFVEIRDGDSSTSVLLGKFCGTDISIGELHSTKNQMYLQFVSDGFHEYRGFSATFQKKKWSRDDTPICGGDILSDKGTIQSPNFPREYPVYSDCSWKITVPEGNRIILRFNTFELENSETCKDDFVAIRDGHDSDSPELGKFCGESVPAAIRSSGNEMTVQFTADQAIEKHGFAAEFTIEPLSYSEAADI